MKIFSLGGLLTLSAVASAALAAPSPASELVTDVATEYLPVEAVSTELPSAVRGIDGYEYRTVRRLKLRQRRDVSHLDTRYLPPSKNYLPPVDDTEEIVAAVEPKLAPEYLPPVEPVEEPVASTEAQPEADVPTAQLRDDGYHYKQPEAMPVELKEAETVTEKEPEAPKDYLPPLGGDVVAEGPADGESALLTRDGYQYRAIRRYRF
ncbi:hypothetical protein ACLKA7_017485 [Drosophila subpalustris]